MSCFIRNKIGIMTPESSITKAEIEKILKGVTIPSPPKIIADLQTEMARPEPDLNTMAELISKDAGLAGAVLKTLNSPFYGNQSIDSIPKAVMMLGMNTVINIVNTLYLRDYMNQQDDISDELYDAMNHFWDTAIDVAMTSQVIAKRIGYKNIDLAYMLGLFHNVGIPLLIQRFPEYPDIMTQSYMFENKQILGSEKKLIKTDHAIISFYTARSWKLPEILCRVIAQHHNAVNIFSGNEDIDADEKYFLAILKLAEHIAALHRVIGNNEVDLEWQAIEDMVLKHLGMLPEDYEGLISYATENGVGVKSYFM